MSLCPPEFLIWSLKQTDRRQMHRRKGSSASRSCSYVRARAMGAAGAPCCSGASVGAREGHFRTLGHGCVGPDRHRWALVPGAGHDQGRGQTSLSPQRAEQSTGVGQAPLQPPEVTSLVTVTSWPGPGALCLAWSSVQLWRAGVGGGRLAPHWREVGTPWVSQGGPVSGRWLPLSAGSLLPWHRLCGRFRAPTGKRGQELRGGGAKYQQSPLILSL